MLNDLVKTRLPQISAVVIFVSIFLALPQATLAASGMEVAGKPASIKFAVLAFRPKPETIAQWQPLVDHLNAAKIGRNFELQALTYPELEEAVINKQVEIVLTQPAHYILLSHREGLLSPLATLVENEGEYALYHFGGAILTRTGQTSIKQLSDLRGKRIAVSNMKSFGGYQAQALELQKQGIWLPDDAEVIETGMPHDKAVMEVLAGRADAAFVRTGVLEQMQREGKIEAGILQPLNVQNVKDFPFLLSTPLYPQWALAAMPWLDEDHARQIAAIILGIPHDKGVAKAVGIHGFTIPENYQPVEDLMRQMRFPPFDTVPDFTWRDIWSKYSVEIRLFTTGVIILLFLLLYSLARANRKLKQEHQQVTELIRHSISSDIRYRNLVNSSPDWIWEVDAQGVYTYVSPKIRELLGYDPAEVLGKTPFDLMPPEEAKRVGEIFVGIASEARAFQGLVNINLHKDGHPVVLETSGVPIVESGVLCGYIGIDRNISERKRTEEELERYRNSLEQLVEERTAALRESELRYRTIANFTSDWGTWNDATGRWLYCSPSCQQITGHDVQEFMDDPQLFLAIIHPDDRERMRSHLGSTCHPDGEFARQEFRIFNKDGSIVWIEHTCQPVYDPEANFIGHRASNRDITERRKIEEAMGAMSATFSGLTGKSYFDAVCRHLASALNFDYAFVGSFDAYLDRVTAIGGYAMGEAMGEFSYSLTDTPCANVVGKKACFYPSDLQSLFPKDALLAKLAIQSYAGIPIFDRQQKPIGILVALHTKPVANSLTVTTFLQAYSDRVSAEMQRSDAEISLRRLNDELQHLLHERTEALQSAKTAAEMAEAANRTKTAFLANMSHELRTPMNHIMGMTSLALGRAVDAKQREQLSMVEASSHHLLGLIDDILDLSRIEAERLSLERIDFKLGEVILNVQNIIGYKAANKGLTFRVDIPESVSGQMLLGDPLRLGQILINLAGNAVKFTQSGHVIVRATILAESPTDIALRFEVEDTGIGISTEDQRRLFHPFEQLDSSMTRKYGGSGLGLVISMRLVKMMGGEIGIMSEVGWGSTFWFTVHLGKGEAAASRPVPSLEVSVQEQLRTRFANTIILVVEDEPINMMLTQDLLQQVGLRSDIARDGNEAVDLSRKYAYDLILMDMQMPNLNGLDATRIIRTDSLNLETPIVAMTANVFEEDKRACLDSGMNDCVTKPFLPGRLYETILYWLDQRSA